MRRRRLADREARMPAALEQRHRAALPAEDQRGQRPGEAGADDRDVGVDRVPRHRRQAGDPPHAAQASHASHAIGAGTRCSRLRRSSRARRASRHAGQVANAARSHRSARTRARPSAWRIARAAASSSVGQRRRHEQPVRRQRRHRARCSAIARVGISAITDGAGVDRGVDRSQQPRHPFVVRHERRVHEQEHAQADAVRGERARRRARSRPACSPCSGARARRGARSRAPSRPRATAPADRGTATCDRRPARGCDSTVRRDTPATARAIAGSSCRRHRAVIEEAARVVELQVSNAARFRGLGTGSARSRRGRLGPGREPELDLARDRAGRRVGLDRVAPEVAHHAAPRALAAGEEDRGDVDDAAVGRRARDRW